MILLVLVVVLWILVLAPSLYRRFAERDGVGSIDHFHRSLDRLEHAGPTLVTPAYRLHTTLPGGSVGAAAEPEASAMYRAKLVLLRPVDDEAASDIDDGAGVHYERIGVLDPPEPPATFEQPPMELRAYSRQQARRRCSSLLLVLTGLTLSTAVLGMLPALRLAWILTALTGIGLLAIVGLIAYAREIEAQQERWMTPTTWAEEREAFDDPYSYPGAATAGLPGAWDDEDDFPQQAAASN